jgi:hypothetical protein
MLSPEWEATLDDGTVVNGKVIHYTSLFTPEYQKRLKEFRLVDRRTGLCAECNAPVIPPRVLIRVRLDKNKRLIYRRRPPLPNLRVGDNSNRKPAVVWLVGWQQTLHHFTDLRGNPANVQGVSVLNERTGEVYFLDRYVEDVGAGTHMPEVYPIEVKGGIKTVLDSEGKIRPAAGALELEEDHDDVAGLLPGPTHDGKT